MDFQPSPEILETTARMREFVERALFPLEPQFLAEGFRSVLPELTRKREEVKADS